MPTANPIASNVNFRTVANRSSNRCLLLAYLLSPPAFRQPGAQPVPAPPGGIFYRRIHARTLCMSVVAVAKSRVVDYSIQRRLPDRHFAVSIHLQERRKWLELSMAPAVSE